MMTPQNQATQMLVNQQLDRYKSDLDRWRGQVERARTRLDAFRMASQKPVPGQLIRALKALHNADRMRAEQAVEQVLSRHAEQAHLGDPDFPMLLRLSQGHWPQVWRRLDATRRQSAS